MTTPGPIPPTPPSTSSGPTVTRLSHRMMPDPRRIIAKPFHPGEETFGTGRSRVKVILDRVFALPDVEVDRLLAGLLTDFESRHRDYAAILESGYEQVAHHVDADQTPSRHRRLLIGAYFTHEFSLQAAAFFNPSVVASPDQTGLRPGELRFVMSARSVGEGHLSSIEFRSGRLEAGGAVNFDAVGPWASTGTRRTPDYDRPLFAAKLREMGCDEATMASVLAPLPATFSYDQLAASMALHERESHPELVRTIRLIHWVASSNYVVAFSSESPLDERVLFPSGPNESRGMEDARFVRFVDEDGSLTFYATYTAFDGAGILPQIIETRDFLTFRISTLSGSRVANKGMALFPRRINGRYAMLGRLDGESLYLMTSDHVRRWNQAEQLEIPALPWALIQLGNCGAPIETPDGWLVLTHGVGPMRRYSIGALLLDLDDPRRVVAQLPHPILTPDGDRQDGYVPNVVYSCGSLVHGDHLMLPYGFSDVGIDVAMLSLSEVLQQLGESRL